MVSYNNTIIYTGIQRFSEKKIAPFFLENFYFQEVLYSVIIFLQKISCLNYKAVDVAALFKKLPA